MVRVTQILFLLMVTRSIVAATACQMSAQDICLSNGAGVHCHPCSRSDYIVCTSGAEGTAQSCSDGHLWDAFSARCVDAASNPSPCLAGINIVLPQATLSQTPCPEVLSPVSLHQQSQQHGWWGWASSSLSNLVSSVASQTIEYVPAVLEALAPEHAPADSGRSALRMQMLGVPTLQQLQQMHANLVKAADMHSHAVSMLQDAQLATEVAVKDVAAAKSLLKGAAGSSSDAVEVAAAVDQAKLLLQQAAAAQLVANSMREAADRLMSQSASEAAGVSLGISGATQQQQQSMQTNAVAAAASSAVADDNSLGIQELAFVGDVLDSVTAQSAPTGTRDLFIDAEDYYYGDDYAYPTTSDDLALAMQSSGYSAADQIAEDDEPVTEVPTNVPTPPASHPGSEVPISLTAVQQERDALLAQLNAVSDLPPISISTPEEPATPVTDVSSSDRAIDFSDVYDELAVQDYIEAMADATYIDAEDSDTATASSGTDNAQVIKQQLQPTELDSAIGAGALMSAELAARWQQHGRKNVGGRLHIQASKTAAVAEAKHKRL